MAAIFIPPADKSGRAKSTVGAAQEDEGTTTRWLTEIMAPDLITANGIREIYYSTSSPFQTIDIYRLGSFGRCLVLDGKIQSASIDEHIYHESLVQPSMSLHPNPKRVFIAGGGEGATARELLRSSTVEKCTMVDIDQIVVETCKVHMPNHSAGAYDDPRFEIHHCDAGKFLEDSPAHSYDVIVLDLADPVEGGPCFQLYTQEFYRSLTDKLAPNGILVTQSGPGGMLTAPEVFYPVVNTLKTVFKHVQPYTVFVPSFMDPYGFTMCSNDIDVTSPDKDLIDQRIAARMDPASLKFYDGQTHIGITSISKDLRAAIAATADRVITKDNPVFIF